MAVLNRGTLHAFGRPADLASELWPHLEAALDLGDPASIELLATIRTVPGVQSAEATPDGAALRVHDRDSLARVVAVLVGLDVDVFAAVPRPPTLEDVYFAIEAGITGSEVDAPLVESSGLGAMS